jgi:regulator of sirC expression with transglutaminase-like and TPR domain
VLGPRKPPGPGILIEAGAALALGPRRTVLVLAGAPAADPVLLRRVSKKAIVMRMLQNLRGVYLRREDWARAVQTLDWLLIGAPELGPWYKQRGLLQLGMKRLQAARADLEKYLMLEPEAQDAEQIRKQIHSIHVWLARMN